MENMTISFIESLLFASLTINAALLIFMADIFKKILDSVDEPTSKNLIELLYKYSARSPYMILVLNFPSLIAIPYYYLKGFGNWWINAGFILWLVTGTLSKIYKIPVYKSLALIQSTALDEIRKERRKLNYGNISGNFIRCRNISCCPWTSIVLWVIDS